LITVDYLGREMIGTPLAHPARNVRQYRRGREVSEVDNDFVLRKRPHDFS
jgi:hypothetical protein